MRHIWLVFLRFAVCISIGVSARILFGLELKRAREEAGAFRCEGSAPEEGSGELASGLHSEQVYGPEFDDRRKCLKTDEESCLHVLVRRRGQISVMLTSPETLNRINANPGKVQSRSALLAIEFAYAVRHVFTIARMCGRYALGIVSRDSLSHFHED